MSYPGITHAKARSLAGGIAIYLVLNRLDVAYDIEDLIERIGREAVAENLNDAVLNSTNSEVRVCLDSFGPRNDAEIGEES